MSEIEKAIKALEEHRASMKIFIDSAPDGAYTHSEALCEAESIAVAALREKLEREQNDPLTIEELREMDGEPVWIERLESNSPDDREWALVFCREKFCRTSCGNIALFGCYGIGWLAYRHRPAMPEEATS